MGVRRLFAYETSWHRCEAIVLSLVGQGAYVNAVISCDDTALRWAVSRGQSSPTRLLLDHGADVTTKISTGMAPPSLAVKHSWESVFELLLQYDLVEQARQGILAGACRMAV